MSTWTTPATWINGAVTAAQMNTEVRDHLNWLHGFADLITDSSASDVGTNVNLIVTRGVGTDTVLGGKVSGDGSNRFNIRANGAIQWGDGVGAPATMLSLSFGSIAADRVIINTYPQKLFTKSGVINDTDIPGTFTGAGSGMIGVDTTNNRLYVRSGSVWKYVALI